MAFNKVILVGNLTAQPELKTTASGLSVCNFSLAVNRRFAKQGEQTVDYINVCAWRTSADFVGKYAKKGNSLVVCGSLQTRNYTNSQGQKVYITEVVADEVGFAGNNKSENGGEPRVSAPKSNAYVPGAYVGGNSGGFEPIEIAEDNSLPF